MLAPRACSRLGRLVAALALLVVCASASVAADRPSTPKPDFSLWQLLLSRYCLALPGKAPLQDTRFDYEQLFVDENVWTLKYSERLQRVREQLLSTHPAELSPADRIAWALNTYNFLVVEQVTLHLLVPNRQFLRVQSPNDIRIASAAFFDAAVVEVEGRPLSIAAFGRRYVYGDTTEFPTGGETAGDPRLAFAMCKGFVGSPPLPLRAFRGDSLEAQLDLCARRALALPRFVTADPRTGVVTASGFFDERRVDYGNDPNRALPFIEKFGTNDTREAIRKFKLSAVSRFTQVDLKLNQFDRPKPKAPAGATGLPRSDS